MTTVPNKDGEGWVLCVWCKQRAKTWTWFKGEAVCDQCVRDATETRDDA